MTAYKLGTPEASEALIKDLYLDLRSKINAWSQITKQTPQARMGYIGQHLVSVVTGYPGGKSGARGYDLIMGNNSYGEIKTCYRVDQLGSCSQCGAVVSSLETSCSSCHSTSITRKDDSKWLISLRNEAEFQRVIEPKKYYFVLFEFENLHDAANHNIIASIWEVNPKNKGFAYCMIDYYLNIRANSASKAPFDMWPYHLKFLLTKPTLIYRALIKEDGTIDTLIFPTFGNSYTELLDSLPTYSRATTLTLDAVQRVLSDWGVADSAIPKTKLACLRLLEKLRQKNNLSNDALCDALTDAIYLPLIWKQKAFIPNAIKQYFAELN